MLSKRKASFILTVILVLGFACLGDFTYSMAKPNCQEKCGNVIIPYPFGIGEGCFKDSWFEITCEVGLEAPILRSYQLKVRNISFYKLQVAVNWTFPTCHPEELGTEFNIKPVTYEPNTYNPFIISPARNQFIGVGCGIFAYVTNKKLVSATIHTDGCISLCPPDRTKYKIDASTLSQLCLGVGCCQTTIPIGLKSIHVRIFNLHDNSTGPVERLSCSRAFVVDKTYKGSYEGLNEMPMSMSWVIGNTTCGEVTTGTSSNQSCGRNAHCIDYSGDGHRCDCEVGFAGNPYISEGCQDVDECQRPQNPCPGKATCVNTIGGYYCLCPLGANASSYNGGCRPNPYDKMRTARNVYLGLSVGFSVIFSTAATIFCALMIKRKREAKLRKVYFKQNGGLLLQQQVASQEGAVVKTQIFTFEELQRATDNFNHGRMCGKGGFGSVYKGMLADGRIVAIKRSHLMHQKQVANFINEVVILSRINHRNIVKLLGCCLEAEVPLLVYEFIANGTLYHHIHYEKGTASSLPWEVRIKIAGEIAGALAYLHSAASTPIFHRDVKSSNILLDHNYNAKIADFGISRSIPVDKTHLTTALQGTFGYLDPQYFRSNQLTDKSDVYSFGVVLVELLTGEMAVSKTKADVEEKSLVLNFSTTMKENRLFDVVEDQVRHEGRKEEVVDFARLAKRCVKLKGGKRPAMKEVATELEKISRLLASYTVVATETS